MAKGRGQKVNRAELAGVFGISLPTVDSWVRAGCPFDQRGAGKGRPWVFDTADVSRWREQRAAAEVAGDVVADDDALKKRKLLAEVLQAEHDLALKKGLIAPVEQMERALSRVFAEVQSNLRGNLVVRCAKQLLGESSEQTFKRVMLAEIDAVLECLAEMDITADEELEDAEPTDDAD